MAGAAIEIEDAREAARRGCAELEGVFGEGTQFCELLIGRPR